MIANDAVATKARQVITKLNHAGELVGRLKVPANNEKFITALALLCASMSDATAITLLIGNYSPDLVGSAFSLLRPMNEKLKRGTWFFLAATAEQVQKFLHNDQIPDGGTIARAIERHAPFNQYPVFTQQFQHANDLLNSFTHGGNQIAIPHFESGEIGAAFREENVFRVLDSVEAVGLTAALIATMVVGEHEPALAEEVFSAFARL